VDKCAHHWLLDSPVNSEQFGRCKKCGAEKVFHPWKDENAMPLYNSPNSRVFPKVKPKAEPKERAPMRHGTRYSYEKAGCRCEPCVTAIKAWRGEYRARNRERVNASKRARRERQRELGLRVA
jgi:hypothetical protein